MCWPFNHKWTTIKSDNIVQPWRSDGGTRFETTGTTMERHFVLKCKKCGTLKFKKQVISK